MNVPIRPVPRAACQSAYDVSEAPTAHSRAANIPEPRDDIRHPLMAKLQASTLARQGYSFRDIMAWLHVHHYEWAPRLDRTMVLFLSARRAPVVCETRSEALELTRAGVRQVYYLVNDIPSE